ncbi:methylmalonyl Co-A mutase-associated GTPase MeaB [Govanella unica]|uniref:Methylmalonyl Co-A mutase-associated GTPase MeaB n=1 Tax=Govanella unica TaxID=2975056 RepID=A0A9X3Z7L3_9PROT|nr:methylmalonyl Co-A mutase-associated GTPase MeaB [Govania unica]MDA5194281.1 methylmalonyl Co-A mutase-associated GTPase MeaB [Govania unica]
MGAALDLSSIAVGAADGKAALARALAAIEGRGDDADVASLLDSAWKAPRGHVLGLTGPPGVGKSSLTNALISAWRKAGRTVAIIAVDPSSRLSGGALLGDRIRLSTDPEDRGVFVRSMAARDRLGGLAALTVPAMVLMRALYDLVVIETVGVGQSETDVVEAADSIVFCVQPGSGDSLQFMKAGIMEIPDITVVTKADMGSVATRARADVRGAVSLADDRGDGWTPPVILLSSATGQGIDQLIEAIDAHAAHLAEGGLATRRAAQGLAWTRDSIRSRFGSEGLRLAEKALPQDLSPFAATRWAREHLRIGLSPHILMSLPG